MTQKLPGNWSLLPADSKETPNRAHCYCIFASHTGLSAMFWPSFPEYLPSLKADVDYLRPRFTSDGFTLRAENEMLVNGRKAVLLELVSTDKKTELNLLVLGKWPVLYVLAVSGPSNGHAREDVKAACAGLLNSVSDKHSA